MSATRFRRPSTAEHQVLRERVVRPLCPAERARFDQRLVAHHYLKSAPLVGDHLRYVATQRGRWLALLAWAAPARHLRARDAWIGWNDEQRRRRLALLVSNTRFLILPECHLPNLASRAMKLCLTRLSADWQAAWQHPVVLAESFVDPQRFRGTAYKVSGWVNPGATAGFARHAADYYVAHDRPKQLWVRELVPRARRRLRAEKLPPAWAAVEARGQRWLGTVPVAAKSNEIPAVPVLLDALDLRGQRVANDARHTQSDTARHIVQERGQKKESLPLLLVASAPPGR